MAQDDNLVLKASGAETSSTNGAGIDFGAPDNAPITYQVIVSAKSGTSPTLDLQITESDDDSTYTEFLQLPQINAVGTYFVTGRAAKRYRRYESTVAGTTPSFTYSVKAVPAGRHANF